MIEQLGLAPATRPDGMFCLELALNHPIDAVWAAITKKSLVDRYYFAPLGADVGAAGSAIVYGLPASPLIIGRVIAIEAPCRLAHSFRFIEEADTTATVVEYTLVAHNQGTRLRIEHRGYSPNSQGYADIAGGWPIIADRLQALLDGEK